MFIKVAVLSPGSQLENSNRAIAEANKPAPRRPRITPRWRGNDANARPAGALRFFMAEGTILGWLVMNHTCAMDLRFNTSEVIDPPLHFGVTEALG
jgi:hypothetical protein